MIIIHGDNGVLSRFELTRIRGGFRDAEVVTLNGDECSLTDVIQALESESLFGTFRLTVLEGVLTGKSKKAEIVEYLVKQSDNENIVIYEKKKVDKRILAKFLKATVKEFKTETIIFRFLEGLGNGQKQYSLTLLNNLLRSEPVEIVFAMLVRQFRLLFLVDSGANAESLGTAPWQWSRLKNQSQRIGKGRAALALKKLLLIDFNQKSGRALYELPFALELFILNLDTR